MELTKLSIEGLTPHSQNYNTHDDSQIQELERSLSDFDQFKNIVVCNGVILAGHGLVEAAKRQGMTEIYALVRDDLTEEQQLSLLVADNATPAGALPDAAKLKSIFDQLDPFSIPGVTQEWMDSMNVEPDDVTFAEYDESIAEGVEVCTCPTCGHEHTKQ